MNDQKSSLREKSLRAVKWNYVGMVVRICAQLLAQLGIARLLGPEVVGSFGYAVLVSGLLVLVIDQGLGWALVYAEQPSMREQRIVLTRVMLVSIVCTSGTFIWADELAVLLGNAGSADVLRVFSPSYLFVGAAVVAQASLRKSLRFRELQIAQTASYVIGYPVVGLSLAAVGAGVWSLVSAWMVQAILAAVLMVRYARHSCIPANPFARISMAKFGRDIAAINLVNWVVDNTAVAFVARVLGASSLGLYTTSLQLVKTPATHLVGNLQTVLFPTAAAARNTLSGSQQLYLTAIAAVWLLALPAFAFVATLAEPIVALLLGPRWVDAAAPLVPLSLAMIPHVLSCVSGSVLSGRGDQRVELAGQIMVMVALGIVFVSSGSLKLVDVCWIFLALYAFRAAFLVIIVLRRLELPLARLSAELRGAALGTVACVLVVREGLTPLGLSAPAHLGGAVFVWVAVFSLFVFLLPAFTIPPSIHALAERSAVARRLLSKVLRK